MKIKGIYWILVLAFLVRLFSALYLGDTVSGLSGAHDEISYSVLGQRVVEGHGLTFPLDWYPWHKANAPQSYYSVTMSLFLAAIYFIFGYHPLIARLIMALLSTAIVWMIYLLTRKLFGEKVGLIAALIAALYAYLIFYGVTLVTETPFILCLLIAIYLSYKLVETPSVWKWIGLGIALALCVLLRMAVIFYLPFLLGWILLRIPVKRAYALIPIGIIIMALIPFTVRNYLIWDRFLLLEAQFGHVFWNGNNPDAKSTLDYGFVYPIPKEILASENDAQITNELLKLGIRNVLHDPELLFLLTMARLKEFFKFWPTSNTVLIGNLARVFSFGIILPFSIAGFWLSRKQVKELAPIYIYILIHTFIYALSWTMIRYRIPIDSLIIPFAALSMYSLYEWLQSLYDSRKNIKTLGA